MRRNRRFRWIGRAVYFQIWVMCFFRHTQVCIDFMPRWNPLRNRSYWRYCCIDCLGPEHEKVLERLRACARRIGEITNGQLFDTIRCHRHSNTRTKDNHKTLFSLIRSPAFFRLSWFFSSFLTLGLLRQLHALECQKAAIRCCWFLLAAIFEYQFNDDITAFPQSQRKSEEYIQHFIDLLLRGTFLPIPTENIYSEWANRTIEVMQPLDERFVAVVSSAEDRYRERGATSYVSRTPNMKMKRHNNNSNNNVIEVKP